MALKISDLTLAAALGGPEMLEIVQAGANKRTAVSALLALSNAWSTYSGTANAIALAPTIARVSYDRGDTFRFRAIATNTGATTINVSGLGAKNAVTVTGVALPAGYIRTDVDTVCVYDGSKFVVQREVEVGSNANGRFTKYADGAMECVHNISKVLDMTGQASGYYYAYVDWFFPIVFVDTALFANGVCRIPNLLCDLVLGDTGTSYQGFYVTSMSAQSGTGALSFYAKGRWF